MQEGGHFLQRKAQIGAVHLLQVATGTPASQRQSRFGPGEHDQMQFWRKVIDEIGQRLMDLRGGDDMIIVQDEQQS